MRMRPVLALLVAVALWPAVALAGGAPLNPAWGVVFPGAPAPLLARQCSRTAPRAEGAWLPAPADIAKLEAGLGKVLTGANVQPGAYFRQYGGLIVGGRHIIYVNGGRSPAVHADWRTVPIGLCDGGALVFGVEFDPATGAFAHFAFNGAL